MTNPVNAGTRPRIRLGAVAQILFESESNVGRTESERLDAAIVNIMRNDEQIDSRIKDVFEALAAIHGEMIHMRAMIIASAGETSQEVSDALAQGQAMAVKRLLKSATDAGISTEKAKKRIEALREWEAQQAGLDVAKPPQVKVREAAHER